MAVNNDVLEKFYKLHQATALITDPYGLETHLVDALKKIVACNAILIFHNKRDAQLLAARNPYNPYQNDAESITIRYNDPLGADILVHRKSVSRVNPQDPVLPLMNAELLSPLNSPDGVLGCIYASRLSPKGFNQEEIKLIEYAAGLMAFALERQGWLDHLQALQTSNHLWQEKYLTFLQSIPFPAFIVDVKNDRIEEASDSAIQLLGGDLDAVLATPFSETDKLHPNADSGILEINGRTYQLKRVKFSFDDEEKDLLLLLPASDGGPAASDHWLYEFGRSCTETVIEDDPQTSLSPLATMIADRFDARFVAILESAPNGALAPLAVFEIKGKAKRPDDSVVADLQNEFMDRALVLGRPVFVDDVTQEPGFSQWLSMAKKLKYQSVAAAPLGFAKKTLGLFVLFCKAPKTWSRESDVVIDVAARLAPLLAEFNIRRGRLEKEASDEFAGKLETLAADADDVADVIVQAALLLQPLVPFDYFSVTFMDEQAGAGRPFVLCRPGLKELLPQGSTWQPVQETGFGWARAAVSTQSENRENENSGLPYSLPVHISLLLMHGEAYIGNFSVARQQDSRFKEEEQSRLREFTPLFSKQLAAKIKALQQQQED